MISRVIDATNYKVFLAKDLPDKFKKLIKEKTKEKYQVFFITDNNTLKKCYPQIVDNEINSKTKVLNLKSGEENKNLITAQKLWGELLRLDARKNCLIINLGGGVISDLGGFVASCYKRGVDFINVPTTLLGMIDASVGGKTAINLFNIKNQIGLFSFPETVYIYPEFLKTLEISEIWSGVAEMIKIALVANSELWNSLQNCTSVGEFISDENIFNSVVSKIEICEKDPFEKNVRKVLNFGHTIGHALETMAVEKKEGVIKHGFAVAAGMVCETYISYRLGYIKSTELDRVIDFISAKFARINVNAANDVEFIMNIIQKDKKKFNENSSFSLLKGLGKSCFDQTIESDLIEESIVFYNEHYSS